MEVVDYIRAGAVCIGLAAPLFHGRRTFLMAIIIATAAGSLSHFFFPQQILSHVVSINTFARRVRITLNLKILHQEGAVMFL